jgi:hypothetical protein
VFSSEDAAVDAWCVKQRPEESSIRFYVFLLILLSGCRNPQPSIKLTRVPDALPRIASDTFGRLEFDLRTGNLVGCDDCTVYMGRPGAPLEDAGSISGGSATRGMFGVLQAGPYELRIEGPGIVPFRHELEVPLRQTTHAAIQLVQRHPR